MIRRKIIFGLLFCLILFPAAAQDQLETPPDYPTLAALQDNPVPAADLVDLARRFRDVTDIPAPPQSPAEYALGAEKEFSVSNSSAGYTFTVTASLQAVGEHIYVWVENGASIDQKRLGSLVKVWDQRIYEPVRQLWGSEAIPGVDGDPRVHTLFVHDLGAGTAAYFAQRHTYPQEVNPDSNEHEMFFVNLDAYGGDFDIDALASTMAHEFQHMIRVNINPNADTWLNEGLSSFTQPYVGYSASIWQAQSFLDAPETQLNSFGESGTNRVVNYGAGLLFVTYFYERYGVPGIQALSQLDMNALEAIDTVARTFNDSGEILFADWAAANFIQNPTLGDGRYGYALYPALSQYSAAIRQRVTLPGQFSNTLYPYSTDYIDVLFADAQALDVVLKIPQTTALIPTSAFSGERMWYSNRGDSSDMTLTRAFDLSAVETATLNYKVWYEIEEGWDYSYLMISQDDGASWEILPTANTTTENPFGNAYGPGYSGASNGWLTQEVALDDYTGGEVLLRFEMITDDAVTLPGLALDDVAIPEIDYFTDFEADNGGWESAGWLWMDNILPQEVWLQVIQLTRDDVHITRWLLPDEMPEPVQLVDGVQRVVIAISPMAPVTRIATPYTLGVWQR